MPHLLLLPFVARLSQERTEVIDAALYEPRHKSAGYDGGGREGTPARFADASECDPPADTVFLHTLTLPHAPPRRFHLSQLQNCP